MAKASIPQPALGCTTINLKARGSKKRKENAVGLLLYFIAERRKMIIIVESGKCGLLGSSSVMMAAPLK